jgi:uncharacterized protein (UPF0332 family)
MMSEPRQTLQRYIVNARHYLDNAFRFIAEGDVAKASEFLWGSMAEAVKAVAAMKGISLRSHRAIWDYANDMAKELDDPSVFNAFRAAHSLHSNFYETELRVEDVAREAEVIRHTVGKLLGLIPPEALR